MAKFCCECGERLPAQGGRPEVPTAPQLPLPLLARDEDLAWLDDRRRQVPMTWWARASWASRVRQDAAAGRVRGAGSAEGDRVVSVGPDPYWCEVAFSTLRDAIRGLTGLADDALKNGAPDATPERGAGSTRSSTASAVAGRQALRRRAALRLRRGACAGRWRAPRARPRRSASCSRWTSCSASTDPAAALRRRARGAPARSRAHDLHARAGLRLRLGREPRRARAERPPPAGGHAHAPQRAPEHLQAAEERRGAACCRCTPSSSCASSSTAATNRRAAWAI